MPDFPRSTYSTGTPWEPRVGYSRAVRTGPFVFVTGSTATGADGQFVDGDAYAQARRTLDNVVAALKALGAAPADVVRTRMFVTDIQADWEAVGQAHAEVFGAIRPATTLVEVSGLIDPRMKVEIEADAVVGSAGDTAPEDPE